MTPTIFRAYDIRGIYPSELNAETARLIAKGYISYLIKKYQLRSPRVIVGKDNRTHGQELQDAFIEGLKEHGAHVSRVEDCPSPILYHAICEGNYDGGVNITASHNPAEYNGFKLLGRQAHSIAGEEIQEIWKIIEERFESDTNTPPAGRADSKLTDSSDPNDPNKEADTNTSPTGKADAKLTESSDPNEPNKETDTNTPPTRKAYEKLTDASDPNDPNKGLDSGHSDAFGYLGRSHQGHSDGIRVLGSQKIEIHEAYYSKINSIITLSKPLKVVIDAGNAIAGKYYPELLRRLGCEVIELYCEQDGTFPNHQPDPIVEANTEDLKKKVLEEKADLGISFDGDGDRLGIIDEKGQFHTADESFYLLIQDILPRHPGGTVVYTISNSLIIPQIIEEMGGRGKMVPVGHSHVEIAMTASKAPLGGEQSGHFFIAENYYSYDDAGYTAAKLCEMFVNREQSVAEIYEAIPKTFSKPELRLPCPDDQKFLIVEAIDDELRKKYQVNTMDGVRVDFEDRSWLGIRASNTSPKLSILMEAHDEEQLKKIEQLSNTLLIQHGISSEKA